MFGHDTYKTRMLDAVLCIVPCPVDSVPGRVGNGRGVSSRLVKAGRNVGALERVARTKRGWSAMTDVLGRHILFSGCAHERSGAPPRRSTIALTRALQLDVSEAPNTGCCGARTDRRVGEAARRQTLDPLCDAARQGLDIVCLS